MQTAYYVAAAAAAIAALHADVSTATVLLLGAFACIAAGENGGGDGPDA